MSDNLAYTAILDQLAGETRLYSARAKRAAENSPYSADSGQTAFNSLLSSLTAEQRGLLSEVLLEERRSAIHDTLAVFSWWVDCRDLGLTVKGQSIAVDLSGMGLHGDFVGRCDGWKWPSSGA